MVVQKAVTSEGMAFPLLLGESAAAPACRSAICQAPVHSRKREVIVHAKDPADAQLSPRTPSASELMTSSAPQQKVELELFMGPDNSWGFLSPSVFLPPTAS